MDLAHLDRDCPSQRESRKLSLDQRRVVRPLCLFAEMMRFLRDRNAVRLVEVSSGSGSVEERQPPQVEARRCPGVNRPGRTRRVGNKPDLVQDAGVSICVTKLIRADFLRRLEPGMFLVGPR